MKRGRKPIVDWNCDVTIGILSNNSLSLKEMAQMLGLKNIWHISRKRKQLGLGRLPNGDYGHITSNKERKARYNAKIKANGYKPLNSKKND